MFQMCLTRLVGRLPRNVAAVMKDPLTAGDITHSFVFYTGDMVHGGQQKGSGVKLRCVLVSFVRHTSVQAVKNRLEGIGMDVACLYA